MPNLDELKRLLADKTPDPQTAHARLSGVVMNALPDLIAEIERLEAEIGRFRQGAADYYDCAKIRDERAERLEAALREIEAIEFGRGLDVAKQIARNVRVFGQ
jgi:hypothetical protein